jgi:hypothetical protein
MLAYLKEEKLDIPLIAAGGIFTGSTPSFLEAARRRAGGDPLHRHQGMRPAGQGQAGILQGQRRRHHRQRRLADRLPDAHAEEHAGDRRRHPSGLRIVRLPARCHGNCAYINSYNREVAAHPERRPWW